MKDILIGTFYVLSGIIGVFGLVMVGGFALEFVVYILHGIFTLELGPLAALWYALWHTLVIMVLGIILITYAWVVHDNTA